MVEKQRLAKRYIRLVKQARKENGSDWVAVSGDVGLSMVLGVSNRTIAHWRLAGVIPAYCYTQRTDRVTGEPVGHLVYNLNKVLTALEDRLRDEYDDFDTIEY